MNRREFIQSTVAAVSLPRLDNKDGRRTDADNQAETEPEVNPFPLIGI